jgi:hypothetical protein
MPRFVFWSLMMPGLSWCLGTLAPKLLRSPQLPRREFHHRCCTVERVNVPHCLSDITKTNAIAPKCELRSSVIKAAAQHVTYPKRGIHAARLQ